MIQVDVRSRVPIYEQIVNSFKEMTINPNTIQKAYQELERQGIIYMKRGQGTFINPNIKAKNREEKMEQLKEEIKKIIVESMYLGITKDEFIDIISTSYEDTQNI